MKKKNYFKWTIILLIIILITGCKSETEILNGKDSKDNISIELKSSGAVLEMSYEFTSYKRYQCDYEKLTEFDLAHINPSDEKQRVQMFIMPDGTVNMVIEEMDFERIINIEHEVDPNDVPRITRSEITGNVATYYDSNRKMVCATPIEMQKQTELVKRIKMLGEKFGYEEVAKSFATMQGGIFEEAIEKMIADARAKGNYIAYDEHYATVRTNLADAVAGATGEAVVIVDRKINKIVAYVNYDENEKETLRIYYGYEKEGAPILNATRTEQTIELPSGAEVWQITCTKIDNLTFKLKN